MGSGNEGAAAPDPLIGQVLGGCLLQERIGRGGMGSVYRATRQGDRHPVAVKILAPFMAGDAGILARFTREVRAASRVRNGNVIRILGSSEENGVHYSLMEYIDGENLADLLKREGRLPVGHAAFIAREVARGLTALHAEGIIHRDVKPSNILIGRDGSVRITDFGIARDVYERQRLTAPGDLLGTLGFAAPEQLEGGSGDARADLYSLGATLHCLLSGVRPPADPRMPFPALGDTVPQPLRELIDRLLARDPQGRPADAKLVAAALFPFSRRPSRQTFREWCLRLGFKLTGGLLAFAAGAVATSSRGPEFQPDSWALVFPLRDSILPCASLFGVGVLMAFFALVRGRGRIGIGLRSVIGFTFLAGALVVAYMAGSAIGSLTLQEAVQAVTSASPEALFAESLALAALGLVIGMRKPGSLVTTGIGGGLVLASLGFVAVASSAGSIPQAISDTREAMGKGGGVWMSLLLAACGVILAGRHKGRLWRIFLAPGAVFASLGLFYWASLGEGSPPLQDAIAAPGGEIALAVLLALGARAALDLRPRVPSEPGKDFDTTASSATPRV